MSVYQGMLQSEKDTLNRCCSPCYVARGSSCPYDDKLLNPSQRLAGEKYSVFLEAEFIAQILRCTKQKYHNIIYIQLHIMSYARSDWWKTYG